MLSINFKKTNYMIISSPKKKTNIRITVCSIEQKSEIKYLGVFIDEHLKWDAQLQHINDKRTKNTEVLLKLRHYVPMSTLKQLTKLYKIKLYSSRKYPYPPPPPRKGLEIPRGWGVKGPGISGDGGGGKFALMNFFFFFQTGLNFHTVVRKVSLFAFCFSSQKIINLAN